MSAGYRVFLVMCCVLAWIVLLAGWAQVMGSPVPMLGLVLVIPFLLWVATIGADDAVEV